MSNQSLQFRKKTDIINMVNSNDNWSLWFKYFGMYDYNTIILTRKQNIFYMFTKDTVSKKSINVSKDEVVDIIWKYKKEVKDGKIRINKYQVNKRMKGRQNEKANSK